MNIVSNDTATSNVVSDEQSQVASTDAADGSMLEATEAEKKIQAEFKASEDKLVELAIATLDPKDMLKKYARLGGETIKHANRRKASFKAWAKQDFDKVCEQTEELIRMRVPIKDIRMSLYARVYLWIEAMKPLVPGVEKLSYFQVSHKFVTTTLEFSAVDLTGEIKKEWLTWVRTTVEQQLSDSPLSMKDLDESIKTRKEEIEIERKARDKRSPEKVLAAEQQAAARKLTAQRSAAQSKVSNAVSDALTQKLADVNDIVATVRQAVELSGQEVRRGIVVFDVNAIDIQDCRDLVAVLSQAGKIAEMKFLRDNLDRQIKSAENALIERMSA